MEPQPADRWHYRRAHDHPMGWAVTDSRTGKDVAYGDKALCFMLADVLNGKPADHELAAMWVRCFDLAQESK